MGEKSSHHRPAEINSHSGLMHLPPDIACVGTDILNCSRHLASEDDGEGLLGRAGTGAEEDVHLCM